MKSLLSLTLLLMVAFAARSQTTPDFFAGKWKVYQFIRNGKVISGNDWLTNPNSWCYIYIEETGNVLMSPNPYVFDRERVKASTKTMPPPECPYVVHMAVKMPSKSSTQRPLHQQPI